MVTLITSKLKEAPFNSLFDPACLCIILSLIISTEKSAEQLMWSPLDANPL